MKCTFCGNPCANDYQITEIANNKAVDVYKVCKNCGDAYVEAILKLSSKNNNAQKIHVQVINSAAELLAMLLGKSSKNKPQIQIHAPCPSCGITLDKLQSGGRFGCMKCYEHFDDMIVDIVNIAQKGNTTHVGKVPKHHPPGSRKTKTESKEELLKTAKLRLAKSIELEQYEEAAHIRDEIKTLEDQMNGMT